MDDATFRQRRTGWRWVFYAGGLVWLAALVTAGPLEEGAIEDTLNLKLIQVGGLAWIGYAGHVWYRGSADAELYRSTEWSSRWGSNRSPRFPGLPAYVNAVAVGLFGLALLALPLLLGAVR